MRQIDIPAFLGNRPISLDRALRSSKPSIVFYTITAWVLTLIFASSWIFYLSSGGGIQYHLDIDVYRQGAVAFLQGHAVYDVNFPVRYLDLPFTYPPFAALVFAPFTWISLPAGMVILAYLTVVLMWWSVALVIRSLFPGLSHLQAGLVSSWAMPLAALTQPVRETIGFGQVNIFLMALVVTDVLLTKPSKWRWTTGILTGMAAAIKLTPLVFGLYFLVRKEWRNAFTMGIAFIAWSSITWIVNPTAPVMYWTSTLFDTSRIGDASYASNQSFQGFFARILPEAVQKPAWDLAVLVAISLIGYGAFKINRTGAKRLPATSDSITQVVVLTLVSLLALQASPVSWSHHFVWLYPLFLISLVAAVRMTEPSNKRTGLWLSLMLIVAQLFPANMLFPHDNGIERRLPLWTHILAEPYLLISAVIVITASVNPACLLGLNPDSEKATHTGWSRCVQVCAVLTIVGSLAAVLSPLYPEAFPPR